MSAIDAPLFTKRFTGEVTFELLPEDGIAKYSILVVSGTGVTLTGTKAIRDIQSDAIDLTEGVPFNGNSQNAACCFTLFVPAGAVVDVAAASE